MTYDHDLAERVREQLAAEQDVAEKAMFGGLAFLLGGRMAVAVSGRDGLMVRVDADEADRLLERGDVEPVVMRGRPTRGWVLAQPGAVEDDDALREWVTRGVTRSREVR